jgi:hypothetical protein
VKKFNVKYKVILTGELVVEASGIGDAVGIIRGDTPFADLIAPIDLSELTSDAIEVVDVDKVE